MWLFLGSSHREKTLQFLALIEETSLSIWFRESGFAFFSSLTLHSLAMAFVVGINLAMALRFVGIASNLSPQGFRRFLPLHWYAVVLIIISGAALLLAYPAKALTNPVFYVKLTALTIGLLITWHLHKQFRQRKSPEKPLLFGWAMLACWVLTIGAGRFLAYTHTVLLASRFF